MRSIFEGLHKALQSRATPCTWSTEEMGMFWGKERNKEQSSYMNSILPLTLKWKCGSPALGLASISVAFLGWVRAFYWGRNIAPDHTSYLYRWCWARWLDVVPTLVWGCSWWTWKGNRKYFFRRGADSTTGFQIAFRSLSSICQGFMGMSQASSSVTKARLFKWFSHTYWTSTCETIV